MIEVKNYLMDGAKGVARAVLAYMQDIIGEIGDRVFVSRWHNGREEGYVFYAHKGGEQLNIAVFEHRNSDDICAVKWFQSTGSNPPNIYTADFGDAYKDKNDVSFRVPYANAFDMASWVVNEFYRFLDKD